MSGSKAAIFRAMAHARRSSRRFQTDRLIPESTLKDIMESTLRSPSSFNLQPTQIILVQNPEIKQQLSEEAMLGPGNQFRTRDASAIAVFLADLEPTKRIDRIYQMEKEAAASIPSNTPVEFTMKSYLSTLPMVPSFLIGEGHAATMIKGVATSLLSQMQPMPLVEPVQSWGYKNASLLAQTYIYAAESHDLATCLMEGFDSRRVKEVLRVPDRNAVPVMVATGYEFEDPKDFRSTPRLNLSEVVFEEEFGSPWEPTDKAVGGSNANDGSTSK